MEPACVDLAIEGTGCAQIHLARARAGAWCGEITAARSEVEPAERRCVWGGTASCLAGLEYGEGRGARSGVELACGGVDAVLCRMRGDGGA